MNDSGLSCSHATLEEKRVHCTHYSKESALDLAVRMLC